ncbi:uncharacterized protein AB675_9918 [Cyphellophora attinorum]|uniref:Uncharacterized protein n=1 Tax=Cyphellophora attinorum TaxID=1664694 RepID=A0A0N1GXV8_9EURO|nr:uncharacterized protein AB675_9918 [Phialophora attinorum]KPI35335.1 hypothetical protein AB675_9918 [Phialophora attinorum]
MTEEVFWTIIFGIAATVIGVITVWQNARLIGFRADNQNGTGPRDWYGH